MGEKTEGRFLAEQYWKKWDHAGTYLQISKRVNADEFAEDSCNELFGRQTKQIHLIWEDIAGVDLQEYFGDTFCAKHNENALVAFSQSEAPMAKVAGNHLKLFWIKLFLREDLQTHLPPKQFEDLLVDQHVLLAPHNLPHWVAIVARHVARVLNQILYCLQFPQHFRFKSRCPRRGIRQQNWQIVLRGGLYEMPRKNRLFSKILVTTQQPCLIHFFQQTTHRYCILSFQCFLESFLGNPQSTNEDHCILHNLASVLQFVQLLHSVLHNSDCMRSQCDCLSIVPCMQTESRQVAERDGKEFRIGFGGAQVLLGLSKDCLGL